MISRDRISPLIAIYYHDYDNAMKLPTGGQAKELMLPGFGQDEKM